MIFIHLKVTPPNTAYRRHTRVLAAGVVVRPIHSQISALRLVRSIVGAALNVVI